MARNSHLPPNKRLRIVFRGDDDYLPGNILKIELNNFMTYSSLTSKPGPRLNLVIGPNGTGKSSLVCAIALGLAGEPQLLGRASSIGDYVKRGEESGWIRISLRGASPRETIVVQRKINKQNKSEWLLHGQVVPKKEILGMVQRFNIQVNNLTQFLPQDRVCEFAKMSPVELLKETEKATGDPELSEQHQFLITKNEELKRLDLTVKQHEVSLKQLEALNSERERDVERLRQRNKLLLQADKMKKKLPWLRFDQKRNCLKDAKDREKEAKKKLQDFAKQILELRAPLEEKKKVKEKIEAASKKIQSEKAKLDNKKNDILEKENQMSVKVKSKLVEIDELHAHEAQRQERLEKAREEVTSAEAELANLPEYIPPREQIEDLGANIREFELAANDKKSLRLEKEQLQAQKQRTKDHCTNRLQEMESVSARRLQALKDSGARHIFEAYQWVQAHRHECRKEVYGPVLVEVNVSNKDYAPYVEGHVPGFIWKAFITQDDSDRDFLYSNLNKFKVPVINFTGGFESRRGSSITPAMRSLGIEAKLDEVISGPPVIKEVLRTQAMLDHSFIGNIGANNRADEASRLGIMDLWTPENHFRWQSSRYGGHVSASVSSVKPSRLFSHSVDARELNEMQQKKAEAEIFIASLESEIKTLTAEQRQLEDEAAKLHRKREDIVGVMKLERKRRQDLANKIEQRKKKLESIENEEDVASAEGRIRGEIHELNCDRYKRALELKELLFQCVDKLKEYAENHLAATEFDIKVREMEKMIKTHENQGTRAQQEYDHCKSVVEQCRRAAEAAKDSAERVAKLTPELQREFSEMPDTIEALEAVIHENAAEANAVLCLNDNVLEEYENRARQIAQLRSKLDDNTSALKQCEEEVNGVKEKWLPTLRGIISRINETFSRNFREMAVAGEVSLDEQGNDFSKYGVLIKVKFRETGELQVLSAHHQSGGERSVSTILYLVSLQDLTHCPFRVVDEINQGMDPINERKMFQQLVRAASEPNTPQCFLLTPKLLPDLEYTEACTILNIMNGPWIEDTARAWSTGSSWASITESLSQMSQLEL